MGGEALRAGMCLSLCRCFYDYATLWKAGYSFDMWKIAFRAGVVDCW
jgi:hypothetical protein